MRNRGIFNSKKSGEGLIKGKFVGPGKGVWIWWKKEAFVDEKTGSKK